MKKIRVWEGLKGWKRNKYTKTYTFTGEKLGFWSDGHPVTHNRGTAFWVYRTKTGLIVIHKVHWTKWTTEDDEGQFWKFASLDEAAKAGFGQILKNARVI
jgi:hypothetical protein